MIRYLILPDAATAEARSRAAFTPGPGDTITVRQWEVLPLADGSGAALLVPEGTEEGLTAPEQAGLVAELPGTLLPEDPGSG